MVEGRAERIDVVEDVRGDGRVPLALDGLERGSHEPLAGRRFRIDPGRVVPARDQPLDEAAVSPAADLEHPQWRRRQLLE